MPRYLSKSRFKEGLDCITKLYYTGKKEYANQNNDDPFLAALAEGGFQVGELAKYLFCEDPAGDRITVDTLDYDQALEITEQKFNAPGKVVIAEGAFKFQNLFIRADIIVKEGKTINLYEVKSKSYKEDQVDDKDIFIANMGKPNESVRGTWISYLYDLAFQKYVIAKAFPKYIVKSHLVLADKTAKATIDGLNQLFQIEKNGDRTRVRIHPGLKKEDLGEPVLKILNLDDVVEKIWHTYKMPTTYGDDLSFEKYIKLCSETYENDERIFAPITSACRDCPYQADLSDDAGLKDGLKECWKQKTKYSDKLLSNPLAFSLWNGRTDNQIQEGFYLLKDIPDESIASKTKKKADEIPGLNREQRRLLQIRKTKNKDDRYYFDKAGFDAEMAGWAWPLNMIDFETSTVALPFYKGTTPYQGSAFQFSHHVMHGDGKIEHLNQFIHFEKGVYPNLYFIRALKDALTNIKGTVFRYHNHENTYLRMIYREIQDGLGNISAREKRELLKFIDDITRYKPDGEKTYTEGARNMVDLYDIVVRYYYPPSAGGRVGLKFILPAIIQDSEYLRNKYGRRGIYGKKLEIRSLNFDDHRWIDPRKNNDPYKTLPKVFAEWDLETLDKMAGDLEEVSDGGAAMTAYNYLQFSSVPEEQRIALRDALLRYCELDTMAMVMLVEGLMRLENDININ